MQNYRRFSRFGIATKGVVYFLIGFVAFITAFNLTKSVKSEEYILQWINNQTFGSIILIAIILGLIGYIFSRIYLTFNMKDYDGSNDKPKIRRIGYFINAIGYLLLLYTCVTILLGATSNEDSSIKLFILQSTFGKIVLYIIAIGLLISAINEWWISFSSIINKMIRTDDLTQTQYKYLLLLGRFGRFCRGIVFATLAYVMARSAYYDLDNLPEGANRAFMFINARSGAYVMGFIAFGVMCYGTYLVIGAKHRNIPIK